MTQHAPCYRHHRHVWIAGCAECTAWHLAALAARRGHPTAVGQPEGPGGEEVPEVA